MQDPVPRVGKFWVLFSRPGQRVLVNGQGDMQVRPTPLDRRLKPLNPGQLYSISYIHVMCHIVYHTNYHMYILYVIQSIIQCIIQYIIQYMI